MDLISSIVSAFCRREIEAQHDENDWDPAYVKGWVHQFCLTKNAGAYTNALQVVLTVGRTCVNWTECVIA